MRVPLTAILTSLVGLVVAAGTVAAAGQDYKEISVTPHRQSYFSLLYSKDHFELRLPDSTASHRWTYNRRDLVVSRTGVLAGGKALFDSAGIHLSDTTLSYNLITDFRLTDSADAVIIDFVTSASALDPVAQKRRGNRFSFAEPIIVEAGEFVRGTVLSVTGDIRIDGEVNKDVVSLFGSVTVGQAAVIRGDVATVTGNVGVERKASVYGSTFNGSEEKVFRKHRLNRGVTAFDYDPVFEYNRVDGALPGLALRFTDTDSTLPTAWVTAGYAFGSTSWRIKGGLEQILSRKRSLLVGIEGHRDLMSDDDWLLSDKENTVYALMVTEDFKDYYEEIGGSLYAEFTPIEHGTLTVGYQSGITNWLPANRDLWALFGGEKRFAENFTTVPEEHLEPGAQAIDTGRIASLKTVVNVDTRLSDPFSGSAWAFTLAGEYSSPDLSSDYDFTRFVASLRRYQKIGKNNILLLRGMLGGSEGDLPLHRTFYLGGLGTLHGYRHKELMGSRFWMVNSEFRLTIPRTDIALAALYDVAQIGFHAPADCSIEVRHSIGGAVYFGDDVRVSVARRLDGWSDRNPRFLVRLEHLF